jgi:phosphatidylserine/phosphatidylglycerophosphate/cardiolipin synthase-like enzyme
VTPGDKVRYSVIPVIGSNADGTLKLDNASATKLTPQITITGQQMKSLAAYFNKGIIATQWVARELKQEADKLGKKANKTALLDLITKQDDPLRNALSGLLRVDILKQLADANKRGDSIYAALYELNDPDLLEALKALGTRAHLVLANGAFKSGKPDENKDVRAALKKLKTIEVVDRIVKGEHFAHNKFMVICDKNGNAHTALSGSTNWTVTGLCTQANNGLIISDDEVAGAFRKQWDLLKGAGNDFPDTLVTANSQKKSFPVDKAQVTVWFAPTKNREDMVDARRVVNGAQEGILFLFFNPGQMAANESDWTLLQTVLNRHNPNAGNLFNSNLYIRGVVNQTIAGLTEGKESAPKGKNAPKSAVKIFTGGAEPPERMGKDVLVPAAIKAKFGHWVPELLSVGVMVHSKVVVVDPFGDHPALITGSHNLGVKASRANDDNMVIVEGPSARELAIAYAVNIIAIFQEYRWRHYVALHSKDPKAFHNLQDNPLWQDGHLKNEKDELAFWLKK